MSSFEDCRKVRDCRNREQEEEEHELEELRIPITVTGNSLAIILQCEECSEAALKICKRECKCGKESKKSNKKCKKC